MPAKGNQQIRLKNGCIIRGYGPKHQFRTGTAEIRRHLKIGQVLGGNHGTGFFNKQGQCTVKFCVILGLACQYKYFICPADLFSRTGQRFFVKLDPCLRILDHFNIRQLRIHGPVQRLFKRNIDVHRSRRIRHGRIKYLVD